MIFIINFKTYKQASGFNAYELAKKLKQVKTKNDLILSVQNADIYRLSKLGIKIFAQHIDPIEFGSNTGKDLPETLKENGACGTLINHSEDRINIEKIEKCIQRCNEINIKSVVCVETPNEAQKISKFNPDYIAIEPPELIGKDVSVSSEKPYIITKTIEKSKNIPVLCGAGIKNTKDISKAFELGSSGILISSGIIKSKNPKKTLENLLNFGKNSE